MKKLTTLLVVFAMVLFAGYALGRHHHVPPLLMEDDALELFLVERLEASLRSANVFPVAYDPKQTNPTEGPDINQIRQTLKTLELEVKLTGKDVTKTETWSTCVPGKNVTLNYYISLDPDRRHIVIDEVESK